ncbi:MAG: hypothetical protein PHS59_04935 [Paludibacter sp.]|nr:hypothetical protein [Paludibacter sp.]
MYNHRTIKDTDEFDNVFANFTKPNAAITWPATQHWFDWDYNTLDDKNTFLEDVHDFELNEAERQAKKIVEVADKLINDTQNFTVYMKAGYQALNPAARKFMENHAIFYLTILSENGFKVLQKQIDIMNEVILEELFSIIQNQ